jgi:hypothetical protein
MSKIAELGDNKATDIKEKYKNLGTILGDYANDLSEAEQNLKIEGKSLEKANRENASWKYYYKQRLVELGTLTKFFEREVDKVRGKLFKSLSFPNNNVDLSDRAKDKYIDTEQAYLDINEIYLEVKEIRDNYEAIVDAFTDRGYALKNITAVRIAQLEDVLLN